MCALEFNTIYDPRDLCRVPTRIVQTRFLQRCLRLGFVGDQNVTAWTLWSDNALPVHTITSIFAGGAINAITNLPTQNVSSIIDSRLEFTFYKGEQILVGSLKTQHTRLKIGDFRVDGINVSFAHTFAFCAARI